MGMFGNRVVNQIGMNLLGVDIEGMKRAAAQKQARESFLNDFQSKLGPQYADAPAPEVALRSQTTPGMFGKGPTVDQTAPAQDYQYQAPQRTSDGLNINSPELSALALEASRRGANISSVLDILKAQQPDNYQATDGSIRNRHSSADVGTRLADRMNINGNVVDRNNPNNENAYFGEAPVKGATPVYDNRGRVVDWQLPNGARSVIGQASQADTLGKTLGTVFNNPNGDGSTTPTLGRDMFGGGGAGGQGGGAGGPGRTQSPDDAAYAASVAKTAADQFNGIVTNGQRAGGMISTYQRMSGLLDGLNTGKMTPAGLEFQKAASSLGIQPNPAWGRVEAADALSKKLALDAMGGSLGAGFSNADRSFVEAMNPSIMNTPQGRKQMIDFGVARAKREQQIAGMARQWNQRAGRLDKPDRNGKTFFDYLDAYANANPLVPAK